MATFNSTIQGSDTGDTLIGTESDQLILGGTAADSIGSQYSNSCLVGSDGNDTFFVNSTVLGVGAFNTLTGGSGADSFDFGTYSLTGVQLFGNQDNDTIRLVGPVVDSSIYGGKGEDSIQLRDTLTNAYIEANSGNDTVNITAGVTGTYLHGGQGDDRFSVTGTVSNSTLVGGSGADLLTFNNLVNGVVDRRCFRWRHSRYSE